MKIREVKKLVGFEDEFQKAFATFLSEKYGMSFKVKWRSRLANFKKHPKSQLFICNENINAIYHATITRAQARVVMDEYSSTPGKKLRSILQKLYVSLCFTKSWSRVLGTSCLEISPPLPEGTSILALGGLRKYRVICFNENAMYVLASREENKFIIERERTASIDSRILGSPSLLNNAAWGGWVSQEFFAGIPASRVEEDLVSPIYLAANRKLHAMALKSNKTFERRAYGLKLIANIRENFTQIKSLDSERLIDETIAKLIKLESYVANNFSSMVNICSCHGDFHKGNILVKGEDFRVIDWEASQRRIYGYDAFVFCMGSRAVSSYYYNLQKIVSLFRGDENCPIYDCWFSDSPLTYDDFIIMLLEDVCFYQDEAVYSGTNFAIDGSFRRCVLVFEILRRELALELVSE
jgi:hypothetical protein